MKVAEKKFDAEEAILHWIHVGEKGSQALILGDVKIQSILVIKEIYQKNVKKLQKAKHVAMCSPPIQSLSVCSRTHVNQQVR